MLQQQMALVPTIPMKSSSQITGQQVLVPRPRPQPPQSQAQQTPLQPHHHHHHPPIAPRLPVYQPSVPQQMFHLQHGATMAEAPTDIQFAQRSAPVTMVQTPSKPPMVKSHSTTKLQKAKKSSFSNGAKPPSKLTKSKSFLGSNSISKKNSMYQTLDFSKSVTVQVNETSTTKQITPLKIGVMKNFEFVFEPGDGKMSSPARRPSTSSTPTSNKFSFTRPRPIDAGSVSSNYSPSPTASEASGHSPLTFTGSTALLQQSPAAACMSKFPVDRVSPVQTSGGVTTVVPIAPARRKSGASKSTSPPSILKMKLK